MAILPSAFEYAEPGYPWDEWTDGKHRSATQGVDFVIEPKNFRIVLHNHARDHGLKVKTTIEGAVVRFEFRKVRKARKPAKKKAVRK